MYRIQVDGHEDVPHSKPDLKFGFWVCVGFFSNHTGGKNKLRAIVIRNICYYNGVNKLRMMSLYDREYR